MDFYEMKRQVDDRKKKTEEAHKENSKRRLLYNIERKFKTTMIGALDRFEKVFGFLWGNNHNNQLTQDEEEMLDMWEDVRTQILDNGNNNMRAAQQEIAQYTLTFNNYTVTSNPEDEYQDFNYTQQDKDRNYLRSNTYKKDGRNE